MLEISILTLLLCETCIVIRKSSYVRDIDSGYCYARPASLLERAVMLEISILTAVAMLEISRPASLLERAVMLEISILTLLLCETCIVIRKSSHVRDIDSDCAVIRDLHRY